MATHDQITTPKWDRDGGYADMEVDHFHEIQLGFLRQLVGGGNT